MGIIRLENLEFFAYHGVYAEERKIGNRYAVDLAVELDLTSAAQDDSIKTTINYESLYREVKMIMEGRYKLLEHMAYQIMIQVFKLSDEIQGVSINVSKHNPPIGGVSARAMVSLSHSKQEIQALNL